MKKQTLVTAIVIVAVGLVGFAASYLVVIYSGLHIDLPVIRLALGSPKAAKKTAISTTNWETYKNPLSGVSFLYPGPDAAVKLDGDMGVGTSTPTPTLPAVGSSQDITFPGENSDTIWAQDQYSNNPPQFNELGSSNLSLTITLYDRSRPIYEPVQNSTDQGKPLSINSTSDNRVFHTLNSGDSYETIRTIGGYSYKMLASSGDKQFAASLVQCKPDNNCTELIKRDDETYPYMSVRVTPLDGTRYGLVPIQLKSHNYEIMRTVVESLRF